MSDYLERERAWVREDIAHVEARTPFSSRIDIAGIRAAAKGGAGEG